MFRHRTISVFILPYRPNKAIRNYVRQWGEYLAEHSFFFAGFLHNFRKCLYKENLTIP